MEAADLHSNWILFPVTDAIVVTGESVKCTNCVPTGTEFLGGVEYESTDISTW